MNNLLIVDDEVFIADGLYQLFKEQSDMSIEVYRTYSAREALSLLDKYCMDIVLTDIQMPVMNGLDMVKEIKSRWPDCHIIILTGYSDFTYAQSAIHYGADFYILKSQGDEALITAVSNCLNKINKHASELKWKQKAEQAIKRAKPLLQQNFLLNLLNSQIDSSINLQSQFDDLEIPFLSEYPFQLVAARLDTIPTNCKNMTLSHYSTTIDVIFHECTVAKAKSIQVLLPNHRFVLWLLQPQDGYDMGNLTVFLHGMLDKIQRYCGDSLQVSVSFIIEPSPVPYINLPEYYHKLDYILTHQLSNNEKLLLGDTDFFENKIAEPSPTNQLFESTHKLKQLWEQKNHSEFMKLYSDILNEMFDFSSPELQITIYHNLCTFLLNTIMRSGKYKEYINYVHDLSLFSSSYDKWDIGLYESFIKAANWLFETEENGRDIRYKQMIYIIHKYIDEHLSEDISLSVLADQVYLNPAYLSRAYKQSTGQNISKYIADRRIEKAKEMLKSPIMKINEIAYAIGYESPAHFSRIFKKANCFSPQEYRDKYYEK